MILRCLISLTLLVTTLGLEFVEAREVNSPEDAIRVLGFPAHLRELYDFDRLRLSDRSESEKADRDWEAQRRQALGEYKKEEHIHDRAESEQGPEYREYLKEQAAQEHAHSQDRREYVLERDRERNKARIMLLIGEAEELGLIESRPRADWRKRNFLGSPHSGDFGGSSESAPQTARNYFDQPPPPPQIEPYEGGYYDEPPPPPPPPMYDENPYNY